MKSKKSQIMSQVFIFILAAAIFILILTYGYKAIAGFSKRSEEVALVEFQTQLESAVNGIRQDYGSVKKLELTLPAKYIEICFVDLDRIPHGDFQQEHPRMYDAWESGTQNVFLVPIEESPINVGKIYVGERGYLCFDIVGGRLDLRLEGLGDTTSIIQWQQ
jgi:hypothetical protein